MYRYTRTQAVHSFLHHCVLLYCSGDGAKSSCSNCSTLPHSSTLQDINRCSGYHLEPNCFWDPTRIEFLGLHHHLRERLKSCHDLLIGSFCDIIHVGCSHNLLEIDPETCPSSSSADYFRGFCHTHQPRSTSWTERRQGQSFQAPQVLGRSSLSSKRVRRNLRVDPDGPESLTRLKACTANTNDSIRSGCSTFPA